MWKKDLFALVSLGFILAAPAAFSQTTTSYTYDDLGRVKSATLSTGQASSYVYDNADNRTSAVVTVPTGGAPPVCTNGTYSFPIPTNVPPQAVSVSLASIFTGNCTSSSGYTLTLTSPTLPLNFTIASGQTLPYAFTVSDGHGGSAGATENFTRP